MKLQFYESTNSGDKPSFEWTIPVTDTAVICFPFSLLPSTYTVLQSLFHFKCLVKSNVEKGVSSYELSDVGRHWLSTLESEHERDRLLYVLKKCNLKWWLIAIGNYLYRNDSAA